jgi:DoxX-like family
MQSRLRQLAAGLAVLQIVDAIASATPQTSMTARLDHLGVPGVLRPVLPVIKLSTAVGLLAGLRRPRVGAMTSAVLVAFYAAAVSFHGSAGDHPAVALPAAAFGASAALCLVSYFIPVIEAGHLA